MLAKVLSAALVGLDAHLIDIEVDIAGGLPQFSVVGLPDPTVRESRDRVRSALKNTGFHFPAKRITVNLAPADIKKEGSWTRSRHCHWHSCRGRSDSRRSPRSLGSCGGALTRWSGQTYLGSAIDWNRLPPSLRSLAAGRECSRGCDG